MRQFGRLSLFLLLFLVTAGIAYGGSFEIKYGIASTLVTNRSGGPFDPGQAIKIAIANDQTGIVEIGAQGDVQLELSIETNRSNFELRLLGGTILRAAVGEPIGAFRFTGNRVWLRGPGGFSVPEWTDDQVVIEATGNDFSIEGTSLSVTTSAGTGANPTTLVQFSGALRGRAKDLRIFPNAGVRGIRSLNSNNTLVSGLYMGPVSGSTPRLCWRAIDIDGGLGVLLDDIKIRDLGTTVAPLDHVIRAYENDYAAGGQIGDRYTRLDISDVACRTFVHLIGRKELKLDNSRLYAANTSTLAVNNYTDRFDAAVLVDNVDEAGSADESNKYAAHISIRGVEFDGASGAGASDIYVRSCAKMEIMDCRHVHFTGRYAVTIDADHCQNVTVDGPYCDGQYGAQRPQQYAPILVINRLAASGTEEAGSGQNSTSELWQEVENVTITNVRAEGWLQTLPALSGGLGTVPPTFGVRGSYWPFGIDSFQAYIGSTAIGTTAGTTIAAAAATPAGGVAISGANTITRSAGSWVAEGYKVGMTFTIASAEDGANDGDHVVATVSGSVLTTTGLTNNAADTTATFQPHLFSHAGLVVGDYFMMVGHTDPENWGVRTVGAVTGPSLSVSNPSYKGNSDPLYPGADISAANGQFTTVAFGDGTGTITRTGGTGWASVLFPGMLVTIASSDEAGNDITVPAMVLTVTATVATLQGITFTADASDANTVITPMNGGWGLTTEAAGDAVKMFIFHRGVSEIGFAVPMSTNIAGRRVN